MMLAADRTSMARGERRGVLCLSDVCVEMCLRSEQATGDGDGEGRATALTDTLKGLRGCGA